MRDEVGEYGTGSSPATASVKGECGKSPEVAAKFGLRQIRNARYADSSDKWRCAESKGNPALLSRETESVTGVSQWTTRGVRSLKSPDLRWAGSGKA